MDCPICGREGSVCGGPSTTRAIDDVITLETTMADNDMEMVIVHVDDGTRQGHDRKFTRKDAAKFLTYTPNAKIVGDDGATVEQDSDVASAPAETTSRRPSRRPRAVVEPEQQPPAETPPSGDPPVDPFVTPAVSE